MTEPCVIHVLDDDEPARSSLRFLLEVTGNAVETYVDAADFLKRRPVGRGVLICDVRMPGMSGIELTRLLKSEAGSAMPIILATGHADPYMEDEALQAGAAMMLKKPLNIPMLLAAIGQQCGGVLLPA